MSWNDENVLFANAVKLREQHMCPNQNITRLTNLQ